MERLQEFDSPHYTELNIESPFQTSIEHIDVKTEHIDDCEKIVRDGKKYYSCTFQGCGKIFHYKSEFVRHKYIHTTERPIQCPFSNCDKAFKREDALKNHIRIHTGEMPFKCQEAGCGKSFPSKAGLRYHALKHKGEKQHRCRFPGCNKLFLNISQLKQHERTLSCHRKLSNQAPPHTVQHKENLIKNLKGKDASEDHGPQGEKLSERFEDRFQRMMEFIMNQNNTIKMRLDACNTLKGFLDKNENLENNAKMNNSKLEEQKEWAVPERSDQDIWNFLKFDY